MQGLEALFQQSVTNQSLWMILFAFVGGVISSLLPCTVGMLPVMLGYITSEVNVSTPRVVAHVMCFILGVSVVMTVLGILAAALGMAFGTLIGSTVYYILGGVLLIAGCQMLGVFHLPLPQLMTRLPQTSYGQWVTPFILGLFFGLTASPCGTPFLAGILGLISIEGNWWLGGISLFCYALGQGMLLLVVGVFASMLSHLHLLRRLGHVLNIISGVFFLVAGALLLMQGSGLFNVLWAQLQ